MTGARSRRSRARPPRAIAVPRPNERRVPARRRPLVRRRIPVECLPPPTSRCSSDSVIAAIAGVIRDAMAGDADAKARDGGSRPASG